VLLLLLLLLLLISDAVTALLLMLLLTSSGLPQVGPLPLLLLLLLLLPAAAPNTYCRLCSHTHTLTHFLLGHRTPFLRCITSASPSQGPCWQHSPPASQLARMKQQQQHGLIVLCYCQQSLLGVIWVSAVEDRRQQVTGYGPAKRYPHPWRYSCLFRGMHCPEQSTMY
jgi:hypothetical protein